MVFKCENKIEAVNHLTYEINNVHFIYAVEGVGIKLIRLKSDELMTEALLPKYIDGKPVRVIGKECFRNQYKLRKVQIPDTITIIEEYAFQGCTLDEIILPNSVMEIGRGAFSSCGMVTKLMMPPSLRRIEEEVFYLTDLSTAEIYLPPKLLHIGKNAFRSTGMYWLELPNGLHSIEEGAFIDGPFVKTRITLSEKWMNPLQTRWKYYDSNPGKEGTGDANFRAISTALRKNIKIVASEIASLAGEIGYYPDEEKPLGLYMERHGWGKRKPPQIDNTSMRLADFLEWLDIERPDEGRPIIAQLGIKYLVYIEPIFDADNQCRYHYYNKTIHIPDRRISAYYVYGAPRRMRKTMYKREEVPQKSTEKYCYYNPNPAKRVIGDCMVRSLCAAFNVMWADIIYEFVEYTVSTGHYFHSESCADKILENHGAKKLKAPRKKNGTRYAVGDFCEMLQSIVPKEVTRVVIKCSPRSRVYNRHMVCAVKELLENNHERFRIYDSWNNTEYYVNEYWIL